MRLKLRERHRARGADHEGFGEAGDPFEESSGRG